MWNFACNKFNGNQCNLFSYILFVLNFGIAHIIDQPNIMGLTSVTVGWSTVVGSNDLVWMVGDKKAGKLCKQKNLLHVNAENEIVIYMH